eukprot:3403057-Amphidinium_carterae.2
MTYTTGSNHDYVVQNFNGEPKYAFLHLSACSLQDLRRGDPLGVVSTSCLPLFHRPFEASSAKLASLVELQRCSVQRKEMPLLFFRGGIVKHYLLFF